MLRRVRNFALALLLAPLGCDEPFAARDEIEIVVLESLTQCSSIIWFPYPCLEVIERPGDQPTALYGDIEGFTFAGGIRQRILVARYTLKDPPFGSGLYEHRLLRVISRQRVFYEAERPSPAATARH